MASVPLPRAPAVFCGVSCRWLPFGVPQPFWLQLSGLLLQRTLVVGLVVSWYTTWFSTLCQHSFPCLNLPLAGSATFLAPVSWPTPAVEPCCWIGGVFGASLGSLPCAVLFLRGLQFAQLTLPQVPLGIFCLFCNRVPVLLPWWRRGRLPFPSFFCDSPAPEGWQGFAGFCTLCQGAPVGIVSALWATVYSPCLLSLTLGWVSFWPAVSTASVSCEVCSLGCPSWFILLFMSLFVLHLL